MSVDWSLVANVASVVGTVGGLLFVWWQVRQIREVNAYGRLRDEVKRFNTPEMRACRARLARTLLSSRRDFDKIAEDGDEVLAFLEDIGLLFRRRVVPLYFIWSMLSHDIFNYWQMLHDYLVWLRQSTNNNTYYEDFDLVRNRLAALERKRTGLEAVRSESDLRKFLEDEVKAAPASELGKEIPKQTTEVPREDAVLRFACPSCGSAVSAPKACSGRVSKCRNCGKPVTVP
jgi:hypothetical protein